MALVHIRGLLAAGLATGAVLVVTAGCGAKASAAPHTCTPVDRQFINTVQLNMASLGLWADEYKSGDMVAADVVQQAHNAATIVGDTTPIDPSLKTTRSLLNAMFNEYARAIQADAKHRDASQHLYRAYGLADFAHEVLVQAEPALKARGCDITALL